MSVPFSRMREFENRRVRMLFDDGHEVIATLLSAVEDIDGSQHLIYDQVEWATHPETDIKDHDTSMYAEGDSLVRIDEAEQTHA